MLPNTVYGWKQLMVTAHEHSLTTPSIKSKLHVVEAKELDRKPQAIIGKTKVRVNFLLPREKCPLAKRRKTGRTHMVTNYLFSPTTLN